MTPCPVRRRPMLPCPLPASRRRLAALALAALACACAHGRAAPSLRFLAPAGDTELSPEQVLGTLHASRAELAACFVGAALPEQGAQVRLDFVIDEAGAVAAAQPPHAGLGPGPDACLLRAILHLRFAPPRDQEPVRVREELCVGCTGAHP